MAKIYVNNHEISTEELEKHLPDNYVAEVTEAIEEHAEANPDQKIKVPSRATINRHMRMLNMKSIAWPYIWAIYVREKKNHIRIQNKMASDIAGIEGKSHHYGAWNKANEDKIRDIEHGTPTTALPIRTTKEKATSNA